MNDDDSSSNGSGKSWLDKLGKAFSSEPRDRDDLKALLTNAQERGLLDPEVLAMMEGALSVSEMQVRDVMVPRAQMVVVPKDATLEQFLPQILESGHSRFPVIGEDRDEVEGVLLAKDLLRYFAEPAKPFELTAVMRPAVAIPESRRLNMLLRDFRASRNHMAIVVDEYGGVAGLVTIEDVLEEIVGDIDDEHDVEEGANINHFAEGRYMVQALTPVEEFNETFECDFSDEDYDTIGGLVVAEFGRLPSDGETVSINRFEFEVVKSDNRRLHLLEVRLA